MISNEDIEFMVSRPYGDPYFQEQLRLEPEKHDELMIAYTIASWIGGKLNDGYSYASATPETVDRIKDLNPNMYDEAVVAANYITYGILPGQNTVTPDIPKPREEQQEFAEAA